MVRRSRRSITNDLARITRQIVDIEYMLELADEMERVSGDPIDRVGIHDSLMLLDRQRDILLLELTEVVEHGKADSL